MVYNGLYVTKFSAVALRNLLGINTWPSKATVLWVDDDSPFFFFHQSSIVLQFETTERFDPEADLKRIGTLQKQAVQNRFFKVGFESKKIDSTESFRFPYPIASHIACKRGHSSDKRKT